MIWRVRIRIFFRLFEVNVETASFTHSFYDSQSHEGHELFLLPACTYLSPFLSFTLNITSWSLSRRSLSGIFEKILTLSCPYTYIYLLYSRYNHLRAHSSCFISFILSKVTSTTRTLNQIEIEEFEWFGIKIRKKVWRFGSILDGWWRRWRKQQFSSEYSKKTCS
jgi:hypothetical protein